VIEICTARERRPSHTRWRSRKGAEGWLARLSIKNTIGRGVPCVELWHKTPMEVHFELRATAAATAAAPFVLLNVAQNRVQSARHPSAAMSSAANRSRGSFRPGRPLRVCDAIESASGDSRRESGTGQCRGRSLGERLKQFHQLSTAQTDDDRATVATQPPGAVGTHRSRSADCLGCEEQADCGILLDLHNV
jgi:hypothetical protein